MYLLHLDLKMERQDSPNRPYADKVTVWTVENNSSFNTELSSGFKSSGWHKLQDHQLEAIIAMLANRTSIKTKDERSNILEAFYEVSMLDEKTYEIKITEPFTD